MIPDLTPVLGDTLECLRTLRRERVSPGEAQQRVRRLARTHAPVGFDLVWEEEACDESVHYDALLHLEGEGTVSLSYCPVDTLPWPLRGVQRLSEKDMLRVNRTVVSVSEVVAMLDFIWDEVPILERLINLALIREELERNPIEVTDADVQLALDAYRRTHRLFTAAATRRWLEQKGMTHARLEELLTYQATVARLREKVTAQRIESYFATHLADFDTARIARFVCADAKSARKILERIHGGESEFYFEAERTEQADLRFTVLTRGQEQVELSTAVFAATIGEVVGPISTPEGHLIVRVLSFEPAQFDASTRSSVQQVLFEKWLAERRQEARVEWFWGSTAASTVS